MIQVIAIMPTPLAAKNKACWCTSCMQVSVRLHSSLLDIYPCITQEPLVVIGTLSTDGLLFCCKKVGIILGKAIIKKTFTKHCLALVLLGHIQITLLFKVLNSQIYTFGLHCCILTSQLFFEVVTILP